MKYVQVECIKEAPGITVGKMYFGRVKQKGFIEILNDDNVFLIYCEDNFK
jgi:hypothetical protein